MQRRIAALLMTNAAGQAVARRLEGQAVTTSCRSAASDLRQQRLETVCQRGLGQFEAAISRPPVNLGGGAFLGHKERVH